MFGADANESSHQRHADFQTQRTADRHSKVERLSNQIQFLKNQLGIDLFIFFSFHFQELHATGRLEEDDRRYGVGQTQHTALARC